MMAHVFGAVIEGDKEECGANGEGSARADEGPTKPRLKSDMRSSNITINLEQSAPPAM